MLLLAECHEDLLDIAADNAGTIVRTRLFMLKFSVYYLDWKSNGSEIRERSVELVWEKTMLSFMFALVKHIFGVGVFLKRFPRR